MIFGHAAVGAEGSGLATCWAIKFKITNTKEET